MIKFKGSYETEIDVSDEFICIKQIHSNEVSIVFISPDQARALVVELPSMIDMAEYLESEE